MTRTAATARADLSKLDSDFMTQRFAVTESRLSVSHCNREQRDTFKNIVTVSYLAQLLAIPVLESAAHH